MSTSFNSILERERERERERVSEQKERVREREEGWEGGRKEGKEEKEILTHLADDHSILQACTQGEFQRVRMNPPF